MTNLTEMTEMTHEELASHGRSEGRRLNSDRIVGLARELQAAVDAEKPSAEVAARLIEAIERAELSAGGVARRMLASSDWSDFDDGETIDMLAEAGVPHVRSVIRGTASDDAEAACYAALREIAA